MVSVADISKAAFDAVALGITDAILDATLSDGQGQPVAGRVVFGGEQAPKGFPIATSKDKVRPAYLEGFSQVAAIGDTITAGGTVYHVTGVRDIVEAGGLVVANVLSASDMLWDTVTFEENARTSDGAGGYTEGWATIAGMGNVPCGLVAMSGNERWASQRLEAHSTWQMWAKVAGINETHRAVVNGRPYQIRFVNNVEQRGVWSVFDLHQGAAT